MLILQMLFLQLCVVIRLCGEEALGGSRAEERPAPEAAEGEGAPGGVEPGECREITWDCILRWWSEWTVAVCPTGDA